MGTSCRKFSFQMVGNIDLWSVPIATKEVVLKPLSCMFFFLFSWRTCGRSLNSGPVRNLNLVTVMYTGSAKDAEYYVEAFKLLVFSRPVTLSSFDVRHCRGQRCCYRPFRLNIPTLYPRPSTVTTTEDDISRFRLEACTSMYGTVALQAQTSRAEHERHTTLGSLAACSSTIKPVEYRATSRIFPLSCIMQLIFCHNQGILMWILWQLHLISSKRLSCRHQVLKGICGGRDNWLHQQVYHP